jgi:hypothetical protein
MITPQVSIRSGFGAATTTDQIIRSIDLTGKNAIVTGGYSGLGRETVGVLRGAGGRVIVPTRDIERARKALREIPGVEIEPMDLLDPAAIDALADRFLASGKPLHLLINSAGVMANPLTRDARGYESQFATNHLGHFQLTTRLLPALRKAGGARVVTLSSPRWAIYLAVVFWSAATIVCALAGSFLELLIARGLIGLGQAVLQPASWNVVAKLFPARRLSLAISVLSMQATASSLSSRRGGGRFFLDIPSYRPH